MRSRTAPPARYLLAVAAALATGRAAAEPAGPAWRPELAVRAAYAAPFGRFESMPTSGPAGLATAITAAVPLTLEAGARRGSGLFLGVAAMTGPVFADHSPCGSPRCSAQTDGNMFRLAVDAHYAFRPGGSLRPWIGLAGGVEWLELPPTTYFGFPYLGVEEGLQLPVGQPTCLGPFLRLSFGRFLHVDDQRSLALLGSSFDTGFFKTQPPTPPVSRDLTDQAWHGWVEVGIRGCLAL